MFDTSVRRLIDPTLDRAARRVARLGWSADAVTVAGFLIGMAGCAAIAFRWYTAGLAAILLNRIADGLDGSLARLRTTTDRGGYLDTVLDTVFYSGVPFGFAVAEPHNALPAAFLIYSFVGTGGSFLAYAALSAKRGITSDPERRKSFYYSVGLMEGTETVLFFVLFCLWPAHFATLAWIFGGLCWITTAARLAAGLQAFRDPMP